MKQQKGNQNRLEQLFTNSFYFFIKINAVMLMYTPLLMYLVLFVARLYLEALSLLLLKSLLASVLAPLPSLSRPWHFSSNHIVNNTMSYLVVYMQRFLLSNNK
jgi:hypothetical protein